MNRSEFIQLLDASLAARQATYAHGLAVTYLAQWPGDLAVQVALARAVQAEGNRLHAVELLARVVAADPEDHAAQRRLGELYAELKDEARSRLALACAHAGDGGPTGRQQAPDWARAARAAFVAARVGDWEAARRESLSALQTDPPVPLPALLHVAALWQSGKLDLARPLAEGFHARWPEAIVFKLCLAECLLATGERLRGIELLHEAAAQDSAGQVMARYWDRHHPYRTLWPEPPGFSVPGPLPAEVMAVLGLNRLSAQGLPPSANPAAKQATGSTRLPGISEEVADIQAALDKVAARLPSGQTVKHRLRRLKLAARLAAGQPGAGVAHYIILSSRTRLQQVFGGDGFGLIHHALNGLAVSTHRRTGLVSLVLYVDDPTTLSALGLRPVNPANAWDVKTLVGKLAARLQAQGGHIGALLIVGGPDVVPFHHLPNPTDDLDADIPSDNPYATADDNYFVPEWAVGRLPSGAGPDPAPLLRAIRHAASGSGIAAPPVGTRPASWIERLRAWLWRQWLNRVSQPSFGYSANVWKSASAAVFNLIGDPRDLLTSPPLDANALPLEGLAPSRLSYFNLHGIEDGPEWYGQRSHEDSGAVPEYPVALRPADVVNSGRAPVIVFSEACYGANVFGKQVEEALCLKFLDSGTRAMVGSTKIAYGSVTTPLIGADLLGRCFWQHLNLGLPAGEALRRAKLQMAQEMHQRQGFLDGEDQKTLISFVLYGDPLATAPLPYMAARRAAKPLPLPKITGPLATVCDKGRETRLAQPAPAELTPEAVAQIKGVVARYLPGMADARWHVAHTQPQCRGVDHACPSAQLGKLGKTRPGSAGTTVVTLSKTIRASARAHPHYARVTVDDKGQVVKVAISR